jgi:hypothetical protein
VISQGDLLATVPTVLTVNPLRFLVTEAPAEAAEGKRLLSMNFSKSWMACMCAPKWRSLKYSQNRGIREDDKCGRDVETQKTMRKYSSERGQRLDESLVDGGRR